MSRTITINVADTPEMRDLIRQLSMHLSEDEIPFWEELAQECSDPAKLEEAGRKVSVRYELMRAMDVTLETGR